MASLIGTVLLSLAISAPGGHRERGGWIKNVLPPGPGYGWGYANGASDGYGYFDAGHSIPLGGDRVAEYFFPRYYSLPPEQGFLPQYYNPYVMRGQGYIPWTGAGGCHPMGPPQQPAITPMRPYNDTLGTTPRVPVPNFGGRVEAERINTGGTGLRP
ncbi:MAG: hypothetical protein SFX72_10130 [Isosphaeraceae bacterium]|nr:hypothetical protein [Isosphaeraceae bacterium]